jgi:hypothetical protein
VKVIDGVSGVLAVLPAPLTLTAIALRSDSLLDATGR